MPETPRTRRRVWPASVLSGVAAAAAVFTAVTVSSVAVSAPAVAADSSAVTVTAQQQDSDYKDAPFPDLKVTVSQTRGLEAQGIVISWTGGKQSTVPNQQVGGTNFLQVFQCWGDDPGSPGTPDRTTCQYGGTGVPGSYRDAYRGSDADVAAEDVQYTAPGDGFANPTYTSIPFRPVDGSAPVASVVDRKQVNVDVNTNQYFTKYTTNMVPWAGSGADGSGSVKFELQTAMQSRGLGCGAPVTASNGDVTGSPCWLVLVPRGTKDSGAPDITQSGLFWDAWKHRIAVKLDFKPLGTRCPIGASERQLAGSELVARAIASWQPVVCNLKGGSVYSAITSAESDAALAADGTDAAPMALTSRALSPAVATDALRYAPIAITGTAISFAIDRAPSPDPSTPADVAGRSGLPFTAMNLTPRLVAKLLTDSYLDALPTYANRDHLSHLHDGVRVYNPRTLTTDPDFLEINDPEWKDQVLVSPSLADLISPQGRSDVAWALWQYVLGDKDARDFLAGAADPWGMTVNPWAATDDKVNASGTGLSLPREDFPKADPVEQPASKTAGPINLVTWRPYVSDLDTGAYLTLRGDGQVLGAWDPTSVPPKYGKADRSLPGQQRVLAITDTASAARYQVVTAALRNPAGRFVTASADSMSAAAAAMTSDADQPQVYSFVATSSVAKAASSAYPLTMPVYAAVNPAMKDAALRADYAAFIRYASGAGQKPGTSLGQLPDGYVPLPEGWRASAATAADDIQSGKTATASPAPSAPGAAQGQPFPSPPPQAASPGGGAAPAPEPVSPAATPVATGAAAASLSGSKTPVDPVIGALPVAVPASAAGGIAAALAVPIIGRRRRRP